MEVVITRLRTRLDVCRTTALNVGFGYQFLGQSNSAKANDRYAPCGLREAVIALFKNGYNPNLIDTHGQMPPLWAAENGQEAAVKLLPAKVELILILKILSMDGHC
jgi:hypothetical protein